MFNTANALFNAGTIGSALPRAPIRMTANSECQATYVARLAGGARAMRAAIAPEMVGAARIRGVRRLVTSTAGAMQGVAVLHCLHPSRITARRVLMLQSVARVHRGANVSVSGVAEMTSASKLSRKQRMQALGLGQLETIARLGSSNTDAAPDDRTFALSTQDNSFALGEGAMSLIGVINKQPIDRRDYDVDCASLVGDYDVVQTATATVAPPGLTVDAPTVFSDRVKLWIGGGTDGIAYKVTVTVYSRDGRVQQDELRVRVKEV